MLLWSGVDGQLSSSCCCGQLLSHHVAVVRGWWSSGQPCCGQGLMVSYPHHVAVVRGWWSAIVTSCCCGQGLVVHVGGQLRTRSLEEPFIRAFGKICIVCVLCAEFRAVMEVLTGLPRKDT